MELLAVFSPLVGFMIAGLLGKEIGDKGAQFITVAGMLIAAAASMFLFYDVIYLGHERIYPLANWITSGDLDVQWTLRIDQLTAVMMVVINVVSACVHIYSIGYMSHDDSKARFMAYLSLFTFAMLMLVTADNLLQLFFGWEGVGLASYLLIGFWNHKPSANAAAVKAFVVNRVGDFGLVLGVMATFVVFGTVQFDAIFNAAPDMAEAQFTFLGHDFHALTIIGLLLFIGAVGKSAQLGLHTWLPDAMEGPTPVSALIHAATMVTAGVFLVARFSPLYEYAPLALQVICVMGGLTAFVAATIGMTQFDIKRVIAYSTMSQLGYMFFALGVSAYGAAIFHLFTHAFFKALLFLGAGSVIHAMSDEQDMRKMGGIFRHIPFTYAMMWIGSLALAGLLFFSGYYSKDMILEAAWADHSWFGELAFWLGIAAAFMTAFYSWRLLFMTFHGEPRASKEVMDHVHESPAVMKGPLLVLAAGALFAGAFFYQGFVGSAHHHGDSHHVEDVVAHSDDAHSTDEHGNGTHAADDSHASDDVHGDEVYEEHAEHAETVWSKEQFWGDSLFVKAENDTVEAGHNVPSWVKYLPVLVGLLGIALAYIIYIAKEGVADRIKSGLRPVHTLLFNKWYFDEIYQAVFVNNAWRIGRVLSRTGDKKIIDGFGPDGIAAASKNTGSVLSRFQTGHLYQYAFVMMIGLIALISWLLYRFNSGF